MGIGYEAPPFKRSFVGRIVQPLSYSKFCTCPGSALELSPSTESLLLWHPIGGDKKWRESLSQPTSYIKKKSNRTSWWKSIPALDIIPIFWDFVSSFNRAYEERVQKNSLSKAYCIMKAIISCWARVFDKNVRANFFWPTKLLPITKQIYAGYYSLTSAPALKWYMLSRFTSSGMKGCYHLCWK